MIALQATDVVRYASFAEAWPCNGLEGTLHHMLGFFQRTIKRIVNLLIVFQIWADIVFRYGPALDGPALAGLAAHLKSICQDIGKLFQIQTLPSVETTQTETVQNS